MKDKCGGGVKEKNYVYESVGEIGRKKMGVVNCVWCVKKKRKKIEKRHMRKNCERKEKWKERKIQSKEGVRCGENRSIGENEGKMGQQDDICP